MLRVWLFKILFLQEGQLFFRDPSLNLLHIVSNSGVFSMQALALKDQFPGKIGGKVSKDRLAEYHYREGQADRVSLFGGKAKWSKDQYLEGQADQ